MIGLLRGRLALLREDHVIIDVGGVGYIVHCSARTLQRLPPLGQTAELRILTQVREDGITLFGFLDERDLEWFKLLQNIQGVGARVALALLSVLDGDELVTAVSAQDREPLLRATGVGRRLASRILSELHGRLDDLPVLEPGPKAATIGDSSMQDALAALAQLGYGRSEAAMAVATARREAGDAAPLDVLIRVALKELAR